MFVSGTHIAAPWGLYATVALHSHEEGFCLDLQGLGTIRYGCPKRGLHGQLSLSRPCFRVLCLISFLLENTLLALNEVDFLTTK